MNMNNNLETRYNILGGKTYKEARDFVKSQGYELLSTEEEIKEQERKKEKLVMMEVNRFMKVFPNKENFSESELREAAEEMVREKFKEMEEKIDKEVDELNAA